MCKKRRQVLFHLLHCVSYFSLIDSEKSFSGLELQILSGFDIYAVVGANKPLQLVDIRVSVVHNESVLIRFEGLCGSPTVSGICIRKARDFSGTSYFLSL